ncbi:hypothetical protein RDI58_002887 [Solanum bulbocastanum]|uniref:Uncharacterized protein n=1 Tax=Solanum bulbocastanum TaxID=147425 RepID=A0AAN8UAC0_SOLBU
MYSSYGSSSSGTTSKYYIKFGGQTIETTVTNKAAVANEWANAMLSKYSGRQTVVGLDNEWKPTFSPYTSNKSATLQLCIDNTSMVWFVLVRLIFVMLLRINGLVDFHVQD